MMNAAFIYGRRTVHGAPVRMFTCCVHLRRMAPCTLARVSCVNNSD